MGTSLVLFDGLAIGVAKGLGITPEIPAASRVAAMIWRLAPPAFQNRLFANLAAPLIELLEAVLEAKRVVIIVGRHRQFGAAALIAAPNAFRLIECGLALAVPADYIVHVIDPFPGSRRGFFWSEFLEIDAAR
jgi:hypothetical protein